MGTIEFLVGEKKYVNAIIRTQDKNDEIIVNRATWLLYDAPDHIYVPKGQTIEEASQPKECEWDKSQDKISALVEINEKGGYILEFTVEIGPERIKEKTAIKVS